MERQTYFITLVLLLCFTNIKASYKLDIYKAYISSDMNLWKSTIDVMNQRAVKSHAFRMELLNYQYGYVGWCIGNDKIAIAENYIDLGEENIRILEKSGIYSSLVNSYKSAFYGYGIGVNLLLAPFIGPKSVDCAKLAIKQDANNPYGYIQYANSQFYMPSIFGGSKKVSLDYYKKAEYLMAKDQEAIKEDWNYLSLLSMIAKNYTELEDYANAKKYYEKILKIEPEFYWVKNELFPDLLKKIKLNL